MRGESSGGRTSRRRKARGRPPIAVRFKGKYDRRKKKKSVISITNEDKRSEGGPLHITVINGKEEVSRQCAAEGLAIIKGGEKRNFLKKKRVQKNPRASG